MWTLSFIIIALHVSDTLTFKCTKFPYNFYILETLVSFLWFRHLGVLLAISCANAQDFIHVKHNPFFSRLQLYFILIDLLEKSIKCSRSCYYIVLERTNSIPKLDRLNIPIKVQNQSHIETLSVGIYHCLQDFGPSLWAKIVSLHPFLHNKDMCH